MKGRIATVVAVAATTFLASNVFIQHNKITFFFSLFRFSSYRLTTTDENCVCSLLRAPKMVHTQRESERKTEFAVVDIIPCTSLTLAFAIAQCALRLLSSTLSLFINERMLARSLALFPSCSLIIAPQLFLCLPAFQDDSASIYR